MEQRSELDEICDASLSLDPDDRMRLIARIWASLPDDYWAAPDARERASVFSALNHGDTQSLADLPRRIARKLVTPPANPPTSKIYSAPRRFDLATIFVVTFAYSLLFGAMSFVADYLDATPAIGLFVGGFVTLVGVAQALLFGGRNPRVASVLAGCALFVMLNIFMVIWPPRGFPGIGLVFMLPFFAIMGASFGYLAGALVGGVFLVADKLRVYYTRSTVHSDDVPTELADIETDSESHVTT